MGSMSAPGLALLVAGILLLMLTRRGMHATGLPAGRIVSIDTTGLKPHEEVLFDAELGLCGRPDYLLRKGRNLIPVEVKSGKAPAAPYESHILQLGAYLMLAWSERGHRPPYGVMAYEGAAFRIPFTPGLEAEVRETITRMRAALGLSVERSHQSAERCSGCGYNAICDQALAGAGMRTKLRL
jgi:CRISPR-associated exonuclease Cas4